MIAVAAPAPAVSVSRLALLALSVVAALVAGCGGTDDSSSGGNGGGNNARPVIYQLVVRHFGNTGGSNTTDGDLATNGCGKFDDITTTAIQQLKSLGVTWIWLTGVLQQATTTDYTANGQPADDADICKGRAGSFYAIKDYFDVCPDYATNVANRLQEFDNLVARIHAEGLSVMIDFVPNHVARSYDSDIRPGSNLGASDNTAVGFDQQNNFYYLPGQALTLTKPAGWNPAGLTFDSAFAPEDNSASNPAKFTGNMDEGYNNASPSETDWYETIRLNYGVDFTTSGSPASYTPTPDTWTKMDEIIAYWQMRGVDGFRCDFAHYVPNEAWAYLIGQARNRDGDVYFIAEAYANLDGLLQNGFDAVYHDASYDALKTIYQGTGTQTDYHNTMLGLDDTKRPQYAQYLENHDERRIASPINAGGGPDNSGFGSMEAGYQLAPLQLLYSSGPVLVYNGQEVGEPGSGTEGFSGDDGRTTIFDYWRVPELANWVNGGAFDGGALTNGQRDLRAWYADLLALCQHDIVRGSSYYGLDPHNDAFGDYPNDLYTFARYITGDGRVMLVVANFTPGSNGTGNVRLHTDLVGFASLPANVTVTRILSRTGAETTVVASTTSSDLVANGFAVDIPDQSCEVFLIQAP